MSPPPSDPLLPCVLVLASGRGDRFRASGGQVHKLAALLEGGADVSGQTVAIIASGGNVDVETFERALAA